ncbi:MAG: UDP-3-O-(3-hydroxymyristoyl)glucosamine N-acyltransferase [Gemmatimonadales bacterium]|nr:UDP-3-O-(3-hydroxymyristoyl)glucosamine N-acyltransferase [Gemmatimonadales bacterium]
MTSGSLTARAVADLVGGRLLGDGGIRINRVRPLDRAGPDALSFAVSVRYAADLDSSKAGAVLVPEALAAGAGPATRIVVPDPYGALVRVLHALYPRESPEAGVDPTARIGAGAVIGADVSIGPYVVLGKNVQVGARCRLAQGVSVGDGVVIGDDSVLGPGVICCPGTRIGSRVVLKAGAVLGGDGFGYLSDGKGHTRIPHVGGCILEDEVEVGSNTCIDRGSIDDTVVGRGTKLDNLVQVGHNVRIGERCLIMAGVGIAGSTRVGNDVILAGHVGVTDHLAIGDRARIAAKSAIFGDVPAGASFSGHPARPHRQFLRAQAAMYRLAAIVDELERLVPARAPRG